MKSLFISKVHFRLTQGNRKLGCKLDDIPIDSRHKIDSVRKRGYTFFVPFLFLLSCDLIFCMLTDYYQKVLFCRPNYNGFKYL